MDEIELVKGARPDPAPATETVAHHRAQLRGAIGDALRSDRPVEPIDVPVAAVLELPEPLPAGQRRHRRGLRLAAVAAAVAVLAATGALVARFAGDADASRVAASLNEDGDAPTPPQPAAPVVDDPIFACGAELPFTLPVPDGFAGPDGGPSGDSSVAREPGQLVRHWASSTATIEVRWPADAGGAFGDLGDDPELVGRTHEDSDAGATSLIAGEPQMTASGRSAIEIGVASPVLGDGACSVVQLTIADFDVQRARQTGSELYRRLFERGGAFGGPAVPLVSESTTAEAPPEIPPCQAPADVPHSDFQGGPVSDVGAYPAPADALQAFIATQTRTEVDPFGIEITYPTIADAGYTELFLPDGSIAYAHKLEAGVTVVHVVAVDGGWTVDRWDATGC